jgi:TonB family protein
MATSGARDPLQRDALTSNPRVNNSTIQRFNAATRFWRNVVLIALAHVALIAGLIHWSLAARSAPEAESLVWLSGAEELAPEKSKSHARTRNDAPIQPDESPSAPADKAEEEPLPVTQAKSEIELPNPTPMQTPLPKPTAKPRTTPKPASKPGKDPKKIAMAKATKLTRQPKSSSPKSEAKRIDATNEKKKGAKPVRVKTESSTGKRGESTGEAGKGTGAAGGSSASEFGWYGNMLHDRFYSAWIQPTANVPSGTKISTLVRVRIEKDGRVSKFEIVKPSGNVVVNESVRVVAKQVTQVDPPPTGLGQGDHYDVKINFELNTNQETAK